MKLKITFLFIGLISLTVFSQVQGPPPPCGLYSAYACVDNGDDFEVFNLVEAFPFITFCVPEGEVESNYGAIVFYETENDMNNETNPISNPTAYTNVSNPQNIYYRTNAINANAGYPFLKRQDNFVEVLDKPTPNKQNSLTKCDANNNGFNTFDLTESENEILAGLDAKFYIISFYETLNDAENNVNELSRDAYMNTTNPQKVYVRVSDVRLISCFEIVELQLNVKNLCSDIAVYLTSYIPPRPGFNYHNRLVVKNKGKVTVSGSIEFTHDPIVTYNDVYGINSGNSVTTTGTGFTLNFVDLNPNQYESVAISMNVPIPTSLGTLLTNTATYSVTDLLTENNTSTLTETVIGSYDPNDILESHGPEILHSSFDSDDYLFYTVRFQNVGTADAINVSIDNTLNPKLDKTTIQMLSSSHTNVFTRTDNQLNWQFDNIHLPSESMDEPNSHGYVYYKIKPLAGYSVGDIIPNTAEIYFDFNPAVITNTFETEFTTTLLNTDFKAIEFSIFPNPTRNTVELKFSKITSNKINTAIYDIQGKLILNSNNELLNNSISLNVSSLKSGMYFMQVTDGVNQLTRKLIIK